MIRWEVIQNRTVGFSFYPIWEMAVGTLLIVVGFLVPILFAAYNGIKLENWGEWIFNLLIFVFLAFLGHNLTFQKMRVNLDENDKICFYQSMREPNIQNLVSNKDWKSYLVVPIEENNEKLYVLKIVETSKEWEFYRSVDEKEVNEMGKALHELRQNIPGGSQ